MMTIQVGGQPQQQPVEPSTPETPNSGLKTRAKSAAILMVVVLVILYFGGFSYTILMTAMAAAASYEWARMVSGSDSKIHHKGMAPLAAVVATFGVLSAGLVINPVTSLYFLAALCFLLFAFNYTQKGGSVRPLVVGILYICFAACVMDWLRNGTASGIYHTLTLLLIVWASDIAAYFTGRTLGGPKLAPSISPKKTWSGFIGSSVGAGLVAGALACPWTVSYFGVETLGGMGSTGYFIMGFVLAMFGQLGDLMISVFKRHFQIKDTGAMIPGHGGVLDRIDALVLVALIFASIAKISL